MADAQALASLSLTHVHYDPNDFLSYFCAWLALVPQGLCIVYVTLIWASREVEIILMFVGQMACETMNFILKRLLKEERPKQMHGKGYGMPSSHAQFVAFFSISLSLFLLFRHVPKPPTTIHIPMSLESRVGLSGLALSSAGLVSWSRTYLSYHTTKQILVGSLAGALCAISWFLLTVAMRQKGVLKWALDQYPARMLRIRDLVVEEDICQAGWEKWELKKLSEHRASTHLKKSL